MAEGSKGFMEALVGDTVLCVSKDVSGGHLVLGWLTDYVASGGVNVASDCGVVAS